MLKSILNYIRNRHSLLFKGLLFLISLLFIVYLFPHNLRFRYDLTKLEGRPWPYDKLVAPFDFAIRKSAAELDTEQSELRAGRKLYFRADSAAAAAIMQRAARSGNAELKQFCDSVYSRGVFAWPKGIAAEEAVMLVSGSVAEEQPVSRFVLRESARTAFTQRFPKLLPDSFITVSIRYDEALTERFLTQSLSNISKTRGAVSRDELLVDRGEIVDENIYLRLLSLQEDFEARSSGDSGFWQLIGGQLLLVAFCLFVLFQFLRLFRREVLANDAWLLFILLFVVLTVCMSYLPALFEGIPLLALPFCILPVVMRAFFDTRIALFVHLITIFIIAMTLPGEQFEFAFIQILSGIVAIFSIASMRNRSQLFFSVIIILGAYTVLYVGLKFITEADLRLVEWRVLRHYAISALLVLLAYPLIFSFEKMFGFVSDVTLLELSDTNNTLLRELAERAPGTFQHSLQVANLAESAIRSIGGNPLLVRTGALYHDIGKADMPLYFIENQSTGVNPHNELSFEESATIIIDHVIRGIEKAKAAKLPDIITDFIRTHHGTTNTAYFLTLYKRNNPDEVVDEELFRYPGPEPYSKETAVLMMADATEASSRSLTQYDIESIDRLVENIIDHQVEQKQFNNCDITLKDISTIKKIFKKKLRSIYHVRVAYPK
jgi:cyclic-di-AMP phosphodiesterase PgpH